MTDLFRLVLDIIGFIWPGRIVYPWQAGAYYICGWHIGHVSPGLYPVIPWFCDVRKVSTVLDTYTTPVQSITTKDGASLDYAASIKLRVVDAALAINNVVRHEETALEDSAAALSDRLADVEAPRLDPENRRSLLRSCRDTLNKELGVYGVEVERLRFTTFRRDVKALRLIGDSPLQRPSDWSGPKDD